MTVYIEKLEEQLLSCFLKEGNSFEEVRDMIDSIGGVKMFWWKPYGMLYKAMCEISDNSDNNSYIEPRTVINHINLRNLNDVIISNGFNNAQETIYYLNGLDVDPKNVNMYFLQFAEAFANRELSGLSDWIKEAIAKGKTPSEIQAEIDLRNSRIQGIESLKNSTMVELKTVMEEFRKDFKDAKNGKTIYTPTYLQSVNDRIGGAAPNRLVMVAAYSNDGKSALLSDVAFDWAVMKNVKVGYITLEMSRKEIFNRFIQIVTGIDSIRIEQAKVTEKEEAQIIKSLDVIAPAETNIIIDDSSEINIAQLRQKIREMKAKGCKIVIIDQLSNISVPPQMMGKPEHIQYTWLTYRFKAFAKENDIAIWFAHQTNRGGDDKKEVSLSRVDQGGEKACDVVIIITHEKDQNGNIVKSWLNFPKNRQGKKGRSEIIFDGQHVLFKDSPESIPDQLKTNEQTENEKVSKFNDPKYIDSPLDE